MSKWIAGQDYTLTENGPEISEDVEYCTGYVGDTPVMARKTIRTSYIGEDTDAGPWDEFNDEAKAWWIDYLCRSHAVEVALLSLDDDDRQEIEEAGQEGAETDAETALDRMEAVLAALDEEATAPDDDDEEEIGALSPLGAALEALEAMRESATKPPTAEEIKAAIAEALDA